MQALKDIVLRLINVYISPYVDNLNSDDLSLSLFSGNLQFHGLHLKKTLLERFGLPVEIVAGDIGSLSISIPWTQLKTQPVKVAIENVYVLARARPPGKVDLEEDERIEQATKQEKLRSAEEVDNAAMQVGGQGSTDEGKQTYIGAIISKVVDNVQVHVRNIHVRYEDPFSTPEHPFAAGVTLTEFKAVSTDSNWVDAFIQDSVQGVHKLVKLGALSVYFDTDTGSLDRGSEDRQGTLDALNAMLLSKNDNRQYILRPVTGEARVILNHQMGKEKPKVDAQVIFDEIGVVFDRDQYRDALSLIDVVHFYRRTHQYHRFRPPEEEFETNPARARWRFALNAIQSEVHDRHKRWTWDYIAQRRDLRKKYVDVFVKKLGLPEGKPLPKDAAEDLDNLERELSYEDIRYFRSVARAQAKKDAATRRKLEAERRRNQPQRQTWNEWLWGVPKVDDSGMTEEEQKEIDEIIDYDRAAAPAMGSTPRDFMKARISATLNKGSFSLRTEPHGATTDIIALVFDSFSADVVQLTESLSGRIALGGFRVYDGTAAGSLHPQIVRVKDIENRSSTYSDKGKSRQTSLDDSQGVKGAIEEINDGLPESADPFFVMEVEQNPLDGHADSSVTVRMRHLEIIYHRGYVEAVVQFFKPPASQLESIGALLDAAGQTLDGIRKETRAGLEYALEQHKTIDLKVDMNAPIIIIPMDITAEDSQALVLDAGHIAVESQLADQKQLQEIQSKRGRQYSDDDFRQLEDLMYDKLSLRLESTQLLMGPSIASCMRAIEDPHSSGQTDLHILERINMSFSVQNAITNAQNLTRFKIAGDLPELQVNFSDRKYKNLMKFIDTAIPRFDSDDSSKDELIVPRIADHLPTFRQQPVEEYTLDDNRSIVSHKTFDDHDDESSVEDKGGEKFYEPHDDTTDTQRRDLQQITFQFSFSVGKLQTSLYKSISPTEERPLATAALEGFGLTFDLRKYDMSVDLFLHAVTLAMIEQGQEQRPLLSSANENTDQGNKLLQVRYMKVQKDSPQFMTVHEGVDQSVDLELSTFRITVAPEPILSLYDFIMTTFVPQDQPPESISSRRHSQISSQKPDVPMPPPKSTDKIRVRVKVTTASVSLENNGLSFALLTLPSADVAVFLRSGTLRVAARLGDLSLEDVSTARNPADHSRALLSIEGQELADFSYETFDPTDEETFPGYNSSVVLKAGSLKFTFLEGPVRDLYVFALKFARMKAIYDAASQAAVQRASEVTRMHYDIVVNTPIIILPSNASPEADRLVLRLGEIVAKNQYLGDPNDNSTIEASLNGISITSEIVMEEKMASVQMVKDVAITANVKQIGKRAGDQEADTEIVTRMSDVQMALTQRQYGLVMRVLEALPKVLADVNMDDVTSESVPGTPSRPISSGPPSDSATPMENSVNLEPELRVTSPVDGKKEDVWTKMKLHFSVNSIALEVFSGQAHQEDDLQKHSIAQFALRQTNLGLKQLSDGAMELEFTLGTLSFSNTSAGNTVHREIIPAAGHDKNQIVVSYTSSGGDHSSAMVIVTVDSPKFTLAVEPLAALAEFAISPFAERSEQPAPVESGNSEQEVTPTTNSTSLAFRVEVVNAIIVVVADDSDPKSQAIFLNVKEILVSQQSILAVKIDKMGMSFGRMDKATEKERVKFLDELNVALSLDTRRQGSRQMTSFDIDIPDPIIFRASYFDIMLILDIVNKASAAAQRAQTSDQPGGEAQRSTVAADGTTDYSTSIAVPVKTPSRRAPASTIRKSPERSKVIVSKEQLKARINGFQLVLVGDLQELPFLHLSTPEFQIAINDWSGDMKLATSIQLSIRYFNLANSYFEPLLDPWTFNLRVNRTTTGGGNAPLSVRFSATDRLEMNLTSAFIELAITLLTMWSNDSNKIKETRANDTSDAPFRIRNLTGLPILVWPEKRDTNAPVHGVKRLEDGADVQWRFEDRRSTRENISAARHNALGVHIENASWDKIRSISVDRAGEYPLVLKPKIDKISHQLMCEVTLENNIKVITFRSTLTVDNQTSLAVEMVIVDSHGKACSGALRMNPGQSCPLPLEAVYEKRFRIRPLRGFGFDYSWSMPLHWKQLVARPIRPISCKHQTPKEPAFYFQAQANFNEKDISARSYPRMKLVLRAPIELENLLPYDLKFRIHDKNTGLSSSNFLVKGGTSPIHTVELSHLLLLSVAPEDTNFKQSDYAIINTDDPELPIEHEFHLTDHRDLKLMLKLHYFTYPRSGGSFKVQVYSPFILLNKTRLPFDIAAKTWTGGQKALAGSDLFANDHNRDTPTPFMVAFPNEDRRNRLYLKVDDSKWSKPLSFEPVAADMQVVMPASTGESEYFVGMSYAEGLGKYKLTKVITIAPRFIVKNTFSYALKIRQSSTQNVMSLKPGDSLPIHQLQSRAPMQFTMAADDAELKWTAPFSISDIGRTNLTLDRDSSRGQKTYLMRVETHIQGSTVFLYISRETEPWPLKLKNETNLRFTFQQTDADSAKRSTPVRDLEPHGAVDYAWDYPDAPHKRMRLMIEGNPLPKNIDMMAIGIQPPVKIPRREGQRATVISMDIQADGSSQVLVISPYNEDTSVYKPSRQAQGAMRRSDSTDSIPGGSFETVAVNEKPNLTVVLEFEGIGISVVTKKCDELLYLSLRGLTVGYSDYPQYYDAYVDCKWIQIDNQLFGGLFPIILYPTVVPKDGKELESHPTLQTSIAILKDRSHGVIFIKYATILLQAMTIELDEDFIFALLEFVKFEDASWKEPAPDVLIEHPKEIPEPDIANAAADIFFEALQLQPMSLELSFMRTDRVNVDEKVSTRNPFYFALNALTMTLGNVNAAPVNFRALFLENSRLSIPSLRERVQLHYQEQFMAQLYRVLGSADFLGNPVGLFNNISSGFSDIFYEPYQGMVMHGNKDIGLGIARGATSFAKKTVFGITDSMTKFTSSLGKGLSAATLDTEYQNKRRMTQRRNKPKHALYGVAAGASAFADSVTSAFEGVASKPMEGAEKDGAAGFAKGVGKGFVGLFTKPAVGVMDFLSASTEGIRNTTTVFDQADLDRVRLPRHIASDGVLRPYNPREALGQSWLKELDAGAYFSESYVAHLDIPGDDAVAILSNNRLLYVQLRKLRVIWQVPFEDVQSLSLEQSGIVITLRGGTPGPFLPVSEQSGREWFFKQIGKVVISYNKLHAQRDD
ncbi:putative late endosome to vacuole transport-related protein [Kockovaella imperatae]|uniref:Putative late endosome to vacuole transport-related protein n=1 Tax=Kockovaella imperatae TaxID=4999 RepID=A0A1Y1UEM0_9TREE|nr:putative late endosome to vacuole transport-related protein [Kockovaella imperatae]ORX35977.1 putative late endosome to vacuole transport-related protein [Kockovaella imperatae]